MRKYRRIIFIYLFFSFLGRHRFNGNRRRLQTSPILHICEVWCSTTLTVMPNAVLVATQATCIQPEEVSVCSSVPQHVALRHPVSSCPVNLLHPCASVSSYWDSNKQFLVREALTDTVHSTVLRSSHNTIWDGDVKTIQTLPE